MAVLTQLLLILNAVISFITCWTPQLLVIMAVIALNRGDRASQLTALGTLTISTRCIGS